jgi:hypothetical protein
LNALANLISKEETRGRIISEILGLKEEEKDVTSKDQAKTNSMFEKDILSVLCERIFLKTNQSSLQFFATALATVLSSLCETRDLKLFENIFERDVCNAILVMLHRLKSHRESVVVNLATLQRLVARAQHDTEMSYWVEDLIEERIKYSINDYLTKGPTGFEILEAIKSEYSSGQDVEVRSLVEEVLEMICGPPISDDELELDDMRDDAKVPSHKEQPNFNL